MLGAIYTGMSGMTAYSQGLQTISSNVANLNTDGYKENTVSFGDLYNANGNGLFESDGGATGRGVSMNTPSIDFSQGQLQQTGNNLDLAIQGNGFLVLLNNGTTYYARTGSFAVDKDGYISDQSTGYRLAVLDSSNQPVAVNVNAKQTNPPVATSKVTFADNLSSSATTASVANINVYDADGGKQTWTVTLNKAQPASTGGATSSSTDTSTNSWTVTVTDANGNTVGTGTLNFLGSAVDPSTSTIPITVTPTDGAKPFTVSLDFSQVSSFSAGTASTISTSSVDGNAAGTLTDVTVTDASQIQLAYSNGKTELEGAVALADVQDPQQLQRTGNGLYQSQPGQNVRLLSSGQEGIGKLEAKELESSNVNLSNEFGSLILIERGFQACSQVVSIANEMIQQLFGIRGQAG